MGSVASNEIPLESFVKVFLVTSQPAPKHINYTTARIEHHNEGFLHVRAMISHYLVVVVVVVVVVSSYNA
jgi:hypothetical protein